MPRKYRHIKDDEKELIEYKPCFREPSPVLPCFAENLILLPIRLFLYCLHNPGQFTECCLLFHYNAVVKV